MQPIGVDNDQSAYPILDVHARCLRRRCHVIVALPQGVPDAQTAALQGLLQLDDGAERKVRGDDAVRVRPVIEKRTPDRNRDNRVWILSGVAGRAVGYH